MSQIDKVIYIPLLIWFLVLFFIFYALIFISFLGNYFFSYNVRKYFFLDLMNFVCSLDIYFYVFLWIFIFELNQLFNKILLPLKNFYYEYLDLYLVTVNYFGDKNFKLYLCFRH